MKLLVVDTTHGGTILASEFARDSDLEVFAWDIYHTLSEDAKVALENQQVKLVDESFFDDFNLKSPLTGEDAKNNFKSNGESCGENSGESNGKCSGERDRESKGKFSGEMGWESNGESSREIGWEISEECGGENNLTVIAPVHCNIPYLVHMTHHQAVSCLLKDRINVPIIEVTGVKGKTSVVAMLKEIYKDQNPLILSSLGVEIVGDGKQTQLQKDISITPASIITAWKLAEEFASDEKIELGMCIFESSLGGTGLADVGLITNIAEDYSICGGRSSASKAKAQMFESKIIVCDHDSYKNIYSKYNTTSKGLKYDKFSKNINTYSLKEFANVQATNIVYGLFKTTFTVIVRDLKTKDGKCINTSFECATFAPAKYHVENVLAVISSSLSMGMSVDKIKKSLKDFKGLPGRTSIKTKESNLADDQIQIIEEINPGINVTAIKKAVGMVKDYENPALVLGGSYGVTCEEIDEESLSNFLKSIESLMPVILTGDLGGNLKKRLGGNFEYNGLIDTAINIAAGYGAKNILLIYRSNYSDLGRR